MNDKELVEEAVSRLWRFVNDYSWWSGQKTIDRGDYYASVILNMLNLVNTSQAYVGEIVYAYANDSDLRRLTSTIDSFTLNNNADTIITNGSNLAPDEEIKDQIKIREYLSETPDSHDSGKVKIKINSRKSMREIKYKG